MTNYKIERGVLVPKTKIHPNPWNPNHMKPRQQAAVEESISCYGQVLELLVRPHPELAGEFQIIDGEHRFHVLPDDVYCNIIHGLPDGEAKKLTIVMNETRGSADKIELAQLLAEIENEVDDIGLALPYEPDELAELIQMADMDWDSFNAIEDEDPDPVPQEEGSAITFTVCMEQSALDVLNQAKDLVSDSVSLSKNPAVAWGTVLERLALDYTANNR